MAYILTDKNDEALSPRKPAPRIASLHERTLLCVVSGFLAVWRRLMMDSVFFQTSLFSRALQCDGWLATVSDAPLSLHFIDGASVAHERRLANLGRRYNTSEPFVSIEVQNFTFNTPIYSSFKDRSIRRVGFRPIELKRPGSQNLSSIENRILETTIVFFDIDSGPYRNGRYYLAVLNDYHQRWTALPS
ncbi:hypothetical protein EVAR_95891_1 [Eumeta japonica]|uniref:Uncharacterized protein n=1 Tax=Eumeta variegata TaxID=151549 RepID=A0A4C1XGC2_EUMVA|nr:hypothetical protein EVAR_95891_1 [Eumeta japonica]